MDERERMLEEQYLCETLSFIDGQSEECEEKLRGMKSELQSALREQWQEGPRLIRSFDDLLELYNAYAEIGQADRSRIETERQLLRLQKQRKSPYFGRVDLLDEGEREEIYIGLHSLMDPKSLRHYVYDWRAPVSEPFYTCEKATAYDTPLGPRSVEVLGRRQYTIENGRCLRMFDSASSLRDEVLSAALSGHTDGHIKNIVGSIQQEQNDVIRNGTDKLLLVLGPAGSGKTSVGLHRLAWLLYHRRDRLRAENVTVISNSTIYSEYVAGLLPELGEEPLNQQVFEEILSNILPGIQIETRMEQLTALEENTDPSRSDTLRRLCDGTFLQELYERIDSQRLICPDLWAGEVLLIGGRELTERMEASRPSSFAAAAEAVRREIRHRYDNHLLDHREELLTSALQEDDVNSYADAEVRLQSRFRARTEDALLRFAEENHIHAEYHLDRLKEELGAEPPRMEKLFFEDALLLALLRLKLGLFEPDRRCAHVLVDEAQDYSVLQLFLLRAIWPESEFTLLADLRQAVTEPISLAEETDFGYAFGKELRVLRLNKSYRCTGPINALAFALLGETGGAEYFRRAGEPPRFICTEDPAKCIRELLLHRGEGLCGIIVPDTAAARRLADSLDETKGLQVLDSPDAVIAGRIILLPLLLAKGLEFDTVIAVDAFAGAAKGTAADRRRLYLCATRALHSLTFVEREPLPEIYREAEGLMEMP
ncbi:MAG: UvrD-helicase domain-containing protein [Clostridia bacterium]|nr:UvrD-helicase domain-containing protein [Clostridia bacterium]